MSGHAILDSCHNCGKKDVELFLVDRSKTSSSCKFKDDGAAEAHHHIHVFVACTECRRGIWGFSPGGYTVDVRHVDPETDMNTTLEAHECPDAERAGWLVQQILDCGLPEDHWIEVNHAPDLEAPEEVLGEFRKALKRDEA